MNKFFHEISEGDQVWIRHQILEVQNVSRDGGFTTLDLEDGSATTRSDFDQVKVVHA